MSQEPLNPSDIEKFAELLARSKKPEILGRALLCRRIGIDPKTIGFIRQADDHSFALELINHLNDIDDQEALCKLGNEIYFTFSKGRFAPELATILTKLNCNPGLRENNLNNQPVEQPTFSSESSPNFPHQPYRSQPPSWSLKIGGAKNKLIAIGGVLLLGLSVGVFSHSQQGMKFNDNYPKLENELKQGNLKEADGLTAQLISGVSNDITKIKCQDLKDIDKLWSRYSSGRFGFNAQSILWKENDRDLGKFLKHVGWVNQDGSAYVQPQYSMGGQALQGQLPWSVVWNLPGRDGNKVRSNYLEKLSSCFP
jgi:hypothetical protein